MSEDVTNELIRQIFICQAAELERLGKQAFADHEQGRMSVAELQRLLDALDRRRRYEAATSKSNT
jgi:hypothetical protein